MDSRFLQDPLDKRLAHLVEECGEVCAAAGKTIRWGTESYNPFAEDKETNRDWLLRELQDLKHVIFRVEDRLKFPPLGFENECA